MIDLLGEYELAIDAKGRFLLPSSLRKQFPEGEGDRFVINRGFEYCLNIFPMETWNNEKKKINELDDFDEESRAFKRLFLNGASIVEIDSADRLLLPKSLQEFARIKKEAMLVAVGNKLEIWDKDTYYNFINQNVSNFSNLAKTVMAKKPVNQEKHP